MLTDPTGHRVPDPSCTSHYEPQDDDDFGYDGYFDPSARNPEHVGQGVTRKLFEVELRGLVNEAKLALADGKITPREAADLVAEMLDAAGTVLRQAGGRWRLVALFLTLFAAVFTRAAKLIG